MRLYLNFDFGGKIKSGRGTGRGGNKACCVCVSIDHSTSKYMAWWRWCAPSSGARSIAATYLASRIGHRLSLRPVHTSVSNMAQITNRVMMIKPACFNFNPETAPSNVFQSKIECMTDAQVQEKALLEFHTLVSKLKEVKIQVSIFDDIIKISSDSVFPNNWISFHSECFGSPKVVLYPMLSEKRRKEKSEEVISHWTKALNSDLIDYSHFELQGKFLEGTGSMVLDRVHRIAYACTSPRTDVDVLNQFCRDFDYTPVVFRSSLSSKDDGHLHDVYHTNVMMSVGDTFAIICLESIPDEKERDQVVQSLEKTNKEIITITARQVNEFAGNVLQLASVDGRTHVIMSTRAFNVFTEQQRTLIKKHCDSIVSVPLDVIERAGGGGTRCMIAEVFPPLKA